MPYCRIEYGSQLCEWRDKHVDMDTPPDVPFSLRPTFSGKQFLRTVQYPIIVEAWEKRRYGKVRKAFEATFTQQERQLLGHYHQLFYKWYVIEGTPETVSLQWSTLNLLQRCVVFFATRSN